MGVINDPIGDLLARMRNAQAVNATCCIAPHSNLKVEFCEVLKKNGWIADVQVSGEGKEKIIEVTFAEDKPCLELKRISKPGRRVYSGAKELRPVLSGFGASIVTTSQGLMTDSDAREKQIGGEVLCTIA